MYCRGFSDRTDLLDWMLRHQTPIPANYVNWVGSTARQIREEPALFKALSAYLDANATAPIGNDPSSIRQRLQ